MQWKTSKQASVGSTASVVGTIVAFNDYVLATDTDLYFRVTSTSGGTDPSAGDNSHFLGAGDSRVISTNSDGQEVRVIRKDTDGVCTLSLVSS